MSRLLFRRREQNIIFQDSVLNKFTNSLMYSGHKTQANFILYRVLQIIKRRYFLNKKTVLQRSLKKYSKYSNRIVFTRRTPTLSLEDNETEIIYKKSPLFFLNYVLFKVLPRLETKRKRKGRSFIAIPIPTTKQRRINIAIRWILKGARKKLSTYPNIEQALAAEIIGIYENKGFALQEKKNLHAVTRKNRVHAKYRW